MDPAPVQDVAPTPVLSHALDVITDLGAVLPSRQDILLYLSRHPDMGDILVAVCRAARARLPQDAQLSLELYRHREADDAYLTLYVRQQQYLPDILERIDAVSRPFAAGLQTSSGWILLTNRLPAAEVKADALRLERVPGNCSVPQ